MYARTIQQSATSKARERGATPRPTARVTGELVHGLRYGVKRPNKTKRT